MSTQSQPAPVLAWHREAAQLIANEAVVGMTVKDFAELSAPIIAAHDPHAVQDATTVRLLEEAASELQDHNDNMNIEALIVEIHAHLAKLKGTQ